jgi:hypothetical protein
MTPDERLDKIEESLRLLSEKYSDERFKRIGDRIDALRTLLEQRADASDMALTVAKTSLNEMRGMAMDQQINFLTKVEYNPKHENMMHRVEATEKAIYGFNSMAKGANWAMVVVASVVSAVISWAVAIYTHTAEIVRLH